MTSNSYALACRLQFNQAIQDEKDVPDEKWRRDSSCPGATMPVDIEVLHNGKGILYHCHGAVSGRDFIAANRRLLAFKDHLQQVRYGLVDETAIEGFQLSDTDMLTIAAQDKKIASLVPPGAVVAVIANDYFAHELTRVWTLFVAHTGWETMAFRSKWKAEGWIVKKVKTNFGIDLIF